MSELHDFHTTLDTGTYPTGAAFIDGQLTPIEEARIPILDWGFTRSDVTYDVVHVWKGRFFRLDDHLERFYASCEALRLAPGLERDEIAAILAECVRVSGLREAYVEMTCTRGVPSPGSRDPRQCQNRFIAFAIPFVWIVPPEVQRNGCKLQISNIPRIPPASVDPTVKNFHWADMTRALMAALDAGHETVVLCDLEGNISEGPGFNVFAVIDGTVVSPGGTVLEGITRKTVAELCESLQIPFELGTVTPSMLREADEIFLSSTAGGVMPVAALDAKAIETMKPGSLTSRIRELYWLRHEQGWYGTDVVY